MERTLGFLLLLFALAGSQPAELLRQLAEVINTLSRLLGG
jgi:hypothetical protein